MTDITTLGWREWVQLPELGVPWIKAKVDTGAATSSLHAFDLQHFEQEGAPWVRFSIHPWQGSDLGSIDVEAPLMEIRAVRSSSGQAEPRPVIRTTLGIQGVAREIDLTLTRRDDMGFRMLVGREAMRWGVVVAPTESYLLGKPPPKIRKLNRETL